MNWIEKTKYMIIKETKHFCQENNTDFNEELIDTYFNIFFNIGNINQNSFLTAMFMFMKEIGITEVNLKKRIEASESFQGKEKRM